MDTVRLKRERMLPLLWRWVEGGADVEAVSASINSLLDSLGVAGVRFPNGAILRSVDAFSAYVFEPENNGWLSGFDFITPMRREDLAKILPKARAEVQS